MGINQIEALNQKQFEKQQEVEIFLNNINNIIKNRVFNFDIVNIRLTLEGLIEKFKRDSISISILSEVSSGKSTFLNALIFGEPILESAIGETTAKIFNIKYDKKFSINGQEKENLLALKEEIYLENSKNLNNINKNRDIDQLQSVITLPNENLKKGIELYDTPGFATVNEEAIITLLKETISKSDATILLLDISQGIKKSEHHFIKDMLPRIKNNKRFIVLNKYDTLIDEENFILKSKEQIDTEIKNLIQNIESKLELIKGDSSQKIETFHLSAKKALIAKIQKDNNKLKESRFKIFEDKFWDRVVSAKDELFEDNIKTFENLKKEFKESLKEEKEILLKKKKSLQLQIRASRDNEDKIKRIESNLSKIEALNSIELKNKAQEKLTFLEKKLVEDILNILNLNLEAELSTIPFVNRIFFWTLKHKYKQNIISVTEDASSFIIKHITFFIVESTKEERKKDNPILEINRDLNILFSLDKYEKRVNLELILDRVIKRTKGYVKWNFFTLIGLLRYNLSAKKESQLKPSFIELTGEISNIKRDLNNIIINSKIEIDEYIIFVNEKLKEIKNTINNQDNLEIKVDNISDFIEEIDVFVTQC